MKTLKSILTGFYAMLELALNGSSEVLNQANRVAMRGAK